MGFNDVHNGEGLLVWLGKAIRLAWRAVFAVKSSFQQIRSPWTANPTGEADRPKGIGERGMQHLHRRE